MVCSQSHDAAGQDIIICLYLDPHSTEVMSQVTRLFPGKAIAEVLSSKAGTEALKFLRHMMTNASPEHPKLDELKSVHYPLEVVFSPRFATCEQVLLSKFLMY